VSNNKGFTLVEILVVIALIALLAGLAVPAYMKRADQARVDKAKSDFATIATALGLYKLDNARLPSSEQGLQALVQKPTLPPQPQRYRQGGYLRQLPPDPWGNPYVYLAPSRDGEREFELISYGADGRPGGEGANADLHDL
jgi:general secretion pathway protein G